MKTIADTSYGRRDFSFDVLINNDICYKCAFNMEDKGLSISFNPICAHCTRVKFYKEDHFRDKEMYKDLVVKQNDSI